MLGPWHLIEKQSGRALKLQSNAGEVVVRSRSTHHTVITERISWQLFHFWSSYFHFSTAFFFGLQTWNECLFLRTSARTKIKEIYLMRENCCVSKKKPIVLTNRHVGTSASRCAASFFYVCSNWWYLLEHKFSTNF